VIDFIALLAAWSVGANETASIELPPRVSAGLTCSDPTPGFTFE
jgi:hypothetical protein